MKLIEEIRLWPYSHVRLEVLTAASVKMTVFWVVAPCSLEKVYQRFRGDCCLHHQGDELLNNPEGSHLYDVVMFVCSP
jgi:hypothetical protein